ncbi:MAG: TniB family NTP-binding protein, partial [Flammeovirgaceae bacterium]
VRIPVVSIQMPPDPTARCLYNSILDGMNMPRIISSKIDFFRANVIETLREFEVRCLMIDEVQHLDRIPDKKQRTMLDTLKYISNELSLPMVAFGTNEAQYVFARDPQLDNRFKKVYLTRWECNYDFQMLLSTYEASLPLRERSNLGQPEMAHLIYSLTNGTIGEIVTLVREAAIQAVRAGDEKITVDHLKSADFESVQYKSDK